LSIAAATRNVAMLRVFVVRPGPIHHEDAKNITKRDLADLALRLSREIRVDKLPRLV